jgi:U3 small nucleolar ribonucleoprotein protein IMP4
VILVTTSRRPTDRIRTLCRELSRVIPDTVRVNRGKLSLDGVAERALEFGADRVIIIDRWKGGPGKIQFFHANAKGLIPIPPTLYLSEVRLQRELETRARKIRPITLIASFEGSAQTGKLAEALSNFLKVPKSTDKDVPSAYQASMHVSIDASGSVQITFRLLPEGVEMSPRIILSHLVWEI